MWPPDGLYLLRRAGEIVSVSVSWGALDSIIYHILYLLKHRDNLDNSQKSESSQAAFASGDEHIYYGTQSKSKS